MKLGRHHQGLFESPGSIRWLKRDRKPLPHAILPLTIDTRAETSSDNFLFSTDSRALALKEALADRLTHEFPASKDEYGFATDTGVPGDFYALRNLSGCGMDPLPIPVISNKDLLESNNIATTIDPADKPWLIEVVRLFFEYAAPANLHIRKAASTAFPFFTSDVQYKKLATWKIISNMDSFFDAALGNSSAHAKVLLDEFHSLNVAGINERQSSDSVKKTANGVFEPKVRIAPTIEEARSGNYSGKTTANKKVTIDGVEIEGHFAMRRRDVFSYSGPPNYFLTAIASSFREVYLHRFSATYKSRGSADKEQRIAPYLHVIGSDVKTMDKMMPEFFIDAVLVEMAKYMDERIPMLLKRMLKSPYVVPPPFINTPSDYDPLFGVSPLVDPTWEQWHGLPSGIAFNPDFGKLWMTFVYVLVMRDAGGLKLPGEIEAFLMHQNKDVAMLNMSDDCCFLTNSFTIAERLRTATSKYAILEPEQPVIYLGDVFTRHNGGVRAFPNPITYVVNMLAREDSVAKLNLKNYAEGFIARQQVYSASPIFRDINSIFEEECKRHISVSPSFIARSLASMAPQSDVDAMFRLDPRVIYYKVDPSEVSPELLNEVVATIPAKDIWPHTSKLFRFKHLDNYGVNNAYQ